MGGFSINAEASLWKKVDNYAFKALDKILELLIDVA